MAAWIFLLLCLATGVAALVPVRNLGFRGSTLLGFLLLSLGMTSPLPLHLTRMMLQSGAGGDAFIGVWNLWWTRTAIAQGINPLFTDWLFHPAGTSLALHTYSYTYGVVSIPAQWLATLLAPGTGPGTGAAETLFVAYNLVLIASFTLSGYFTYRLALVVTGHRAASVIAGIIFAFTNYRFANTVRLHVIATELLVLTLWAWIAMWRRFTPWGLVRWLGSFVLLLYASLEYAAYSVVLLLVPVLGGIERGAVRPESAPAPGSGGARRWTGPVAAAVLITLAFVVPFGAQLLRRLSIGDTRFDPQLAVFFSADLLDFVLPNPRHPLWGEPFRTFTGRLHLGDSGFGLSLGLASLVLLGAGAGAVFRARRGRRWFWGFVVFLVLSLGPRLHIGGRVLEQPPLPQAFLARAVPFLGGSRTPIRYAAPMGICLALTVAAGWAARRRRAEGGGSEEAEAKSAGAGGTIAAIGRESMTRIELAAAGLILLESLAAPLPMIAVPIPEVYGLVPPSPGYYAIIPAPAMPARESLLYQTVHRQRLALSVESAMPLHSPQPNGPFLPQHWEALARNLATPGWIAGMPDGQRVQLVGALQRILQENQVRWVVLHRTRLAIAPDGRSFLEAAVCDEQQFAAFRDHLRLLHPLRERAADGAILFEFETPEIRD